MSFFRRNEDAGETAIDWEHAKRFMRNRLLKNYARFGASTIEDLVQEALVRLLRAVRRERPRQLEALMATIVQRTAIDHLRRERRTRSIFEPMGDAAMNRPAASLSSDVQDLLEFTVVEFFRHQRSTCVELAIAFFRERDWQSVASELAIPYDALRSRWYRCVNLLRDSVRSDPDLGILLDLAEG